MHINKSKFKCKNGSFNVQIPIPIYSVPSYAFRFDSPWNHVTVNPLGVLVPEIFILLHTATQRGHHDRLAHIVLQFPKTWKADTENKLLLGKLISIPSCPVLFCHISNTKRGQPAFGLPTPKPTKQNCELQIK